ncbi:MAG: HAMP domain-containing histidine kinase [Planctomycetes bacterium]|nr:HAMP domain-containing histidine kinase [Planctomycetota bacterium]
MPTSVDAHGVAWELASRRRRPGEVPALRITLVFILTLILPSVLLTAFAYQAIETERRARLADRSRALRGEAEWVARDLDELLASRARPLQVEAALLGGRSPLEAVPAVQRLVAREPIFRAFMVLDRAGRRVHPATPATALERRPAPASVVGGLTGACLPPDEVALLRAIEAQALERREEALEALALLRRRGTPAGRAAALFDAGRLHEGSATLTGMLNALEAYGELRRLPLEATCARGRPVAAHGRFRHALVCYTLKNRPAFREGLLGLLDELERAGEALPAEAVVELAERAGALLQDEGEEALAAARAIGARRQQLEQACARLEQLFGPALLAALGGARPPRTGPAPEPSGVLSGGARHAAEVAEERPHFLKARSALRHELVAHAALWGRPADRALGVVAVAVDLDALERELRARVRTRGWGGELVPVEAAAGLVGPESEDAVALPLRAPLEHVAVVVRAPPDPPGLVESALDLPRDTVYLWVIALAVGGIAAGVLATTRTVLREAKAGQLKSDFVTNVTHELKTPLTSIRMFLDTLLLGRVTDEAETRECLQVMAREAERLTRLIEQLLVFSRIESKKWRLKLGFEHPRALVDEALKVLADQLGRPKDELGIEVVAVQDLPQIAVDRFGVVEAVLNILHNAWKYTPGPDRRIRVVITSRRRHVEIAVEDNGIGVPRRDRRRIFVKFERGTNAEEKRIEGSGIGLTMATSIVQAHGGTITYAPNKPHGSRFSIWLRK